MYKLNPPAVFAHESVMNDPRYRERLENVVSALSKPVEPEIYKDEDLPELIKERRIMSSRVPMGTLKEICDPILLFNTFRFDGQRTEKLKWLKEQGVNSANASLMGYGPFAWSPYNLSSDPNGAR